MLSFFLIFDRHSMYPLNLQNHVLQFWDIFLCYLFFNFFSTFFFWSLFLEILLVGYQTSQTNPLSFSYFSLLFQSFLFFSDFLNALIKLFCGKHICKWPLSCFRSFHQENYLLIFKCFSTWYPPLQCGWVLELDSNRWNVTRCIESI